MDLLVSEVPAWFVLGAAFVFGSIWGSFFNVAIYRWPREMSVVRPASQCPGCGAPVAARYNVPILGFLLLRGKTACCGAKLSSRYPLVEALSGVLCVAVAQRFILGADPETALWRASAIALCYFAFVGGLIIATFVDLEHMQIPDEVSLPGAALGLASAVLRDPEHVADFAFGAGVGFLLVQLVFVWSYEHLFGRRGMGEGDSKLLMMIGAFLGYQGVLFAMFAGAAQGLIAFVVARLAGAGNNADSAASDRVGAALQVESQPSAASEEGAESTPRGAVGRSADSTDASEQRAADGSAEPAHSIAQRSSDGSTQRSPDRTAQRSSDGSAHRAPDSTARHAGDGSAHLGPDGPARAGAPDAPSLAGAEPRDGAPVPHDSDHEDDVDLDDAPPEYWGHMKLPFGPFLALGAIEFLFFGERAIEAWASLFS